MSIIETGQVSRPTFYGTSLHDYSLQTITPSQMFAPPGDQPRHRCLVKCLSCVCTSTTLIPNPFVSYLTDNLSDNIHMPILGGKVCIGSQHGWLIVVDNTVCVISLYNPFTQQEIKLPTHVDIVARVFPDDAIPLSEYDFISKWFSINKVVLLCAPTSTAPFPAAAALFDSGHSMYKWEGECGWKLLLTYCFTDITSWRGTFVGITTEGNVYILDRDGPKPKFEYIGKGSPDHDTAPSYHKHLVSFNNNLLQVWWLNYFQTNGTIIVKIMQLDPQRRFTWIPIDDLCGHSLFLSTAHSFSLSSQHIHGLKDNLVYVIEDLWGDDKADDLINWKREIGVFNMKNGTYEICTFPNTRLPHTTSAFWYVPPSSELRSQSF